MSRRDKLSSDWLKLVFGTDFSIGKGLVEGLLSDLVATHDLLWDSMPGHTLRTFEVASACLDVRLVAASL